MVAKEDPGRTDRLRDPESALWDRIFEYGYLGLMALVSLMAFVDTTMLTYAQVWWMYEMIPWVRLVLLLFVGAKLARERAWTWWEILPALLLCGALLRSWQRVDRAYILELALLIPGARGVDFKKIARVHFLVVGAGLLVTMALALTGVIENLVYHRSGRIRMAFGTIYPTDFAAQVFFLAASWAWIRARRITAWEIGGIALLGVFCFVFCQARNGAACLLLLAAGLLYLKLRRARGTKRGVPYRVTRPAQWLMVLAAPAAALVMILLSRLYTGSGWMAWLDKLLSKRLRLGHQAFGTYAVRLFGQYIPMNGNGGTTDAVEDYFFLDCSYINVLFCFGLVVLLCLLGTMVISALREKRLGAWERLGILAVVALQCMVEHHMVEIAYNVFLLLPLAASGGDLLPDAEEGSPPTAGRHIA